MTNQYQQELQTHLPLKLADSSPVVLDLIHFAATETKASCLKHRKINMLRDFLQTKYRMSMVEELGT